MLGNCDTVEKMNDFLGAKNYRQFLRLLWSWNDLLESLVPLESDFVKETKRSDGDENRTDRQLLFIRQVNLVSTNFLRSKHLWRSAEMSRKHRDLEHVSVLGVDCEIADLHVLDHALPE
jgi:hypothetical protein